MEHDAPMQVSNLAGSLLGDQICQLGEPFQGRPPLQRCLHVVLTDASSLRTRSRSSQGAHVFFFGMPLCESRDDGAEAPMPSGSRELMPRGSEWHQRPMPPTCMWELLARM
eukprot:4076311-Pyramimonas_sp.AAC.1